MTENGGGRGSVRIRPRFDYPDAAVLQVDRAEMPVFTRQERIL